jgi:hypothetical protein
MPPSTGSTPSPRSTRRAAPFPSSSCPETRGRIEEALRRGASDSLAKPFGFRELEEKIVRLLGAPGSLLAAFARRGLRPRAASAA